VRVAFLTRNANQEREGQINEALVVGVRDEYQRLFASAEVKELIAMYDGAEDGAQRLKACDFVLGVLSNGSLKGSYLHYACLSLLRRSQHMCGCGARVALERDLGHIFESFAFTVTEADKPDPTKYLQVPAPRQGRYALSTLWRTHSVRSTLGTQIDQRGAP